MLHVSSIISCDCVIPARPFSACVTPGISCHPHPEGAPYKYILLTSCAHSPQQPRLEPRFHSIPPMHRDPLPPLHQSPAALINAARNASAWSSLPQRFTVVDLSQWDSIILGDGWNDTTRTCLVSSPVTFPKERVGALWVLVTTAELYPNTLCQVCRLIFASRDDCFRRSSCECLLHDVLHHAPLHR